MLNHLDIVLSVSSLGRKRGRRHSHPLIVAGAMLIAGGSSLFSANPAAEGEAARIIEVTGVKGGFVVHLGAGDGQLTAALRRNSRYQVQGLDRDATEFNWDEKPREFQAVEASTGRVFWKKEGAFASLTLAVDGQRVVYRVCLRANRELMGKSAATGNRPNHLFCLEPQ